MWDELLKLLGRVVLAYQDVLALGEKKREYLVSVDMKALEELLEQEKELAHHVQKLEKERKDMMKKIAETVKGIRPESKLTELYSYAPSRPVEDRLKKLHRDLDQLIQKVKELNENNTVLTRAALDAVAFHLNRVSGARVEPAYGSNGQDVVSRDKQLDFKA